MRKRVYTAGSAYTRRGPVNHAAGSSRSSESPRPNNFLDWWAWGVEQADAVDEHPLRLHDHHRPPEPQSADTKDDLGRRLTKVRDQAIVGQPYSVPFERRLESAFEIAQLMRATPGHELKVKRLPPSPLRSASKSLHNARGPGQSHEYRIISALLSGLTDPEHVRIIGLGGPRRDYFEAAAIRALEFVWQKCQDELRRADDLPAPGAA